jgi:hypothetical protein
VLIWHASDVPDVYVVALHSCFPSVVVAEKSEDAKLVPISVTRDDVHVAVLYGWKRVRTGASNENAESLVPVSCETSTRIDVEDEPAGAEQRTVESDVHDVVLHWVLPSMELGELPDLAKLTPKRVTLAPPVNAVFTESAYDMEGESNVNKDKAVPVIREIVVVKPTDTPYPLGVLHISNVGLVHDVVEHAVAIDIRIDCV